MNLFSISYYNGPSDYATYECHDKGDNIEDMIPEVIDDLWKYYHCLGVNSVQNAGGVLSWELHKQWYSTDQISRMMALKVFT